MSTPSQFFDARMPDRFWSRVQPCPISGCWLWVGGQTAAGYGIVTIDGRRASTVQSTAHRWAFVSLVGPIPPDLEIDHKCRVRCCCNPDHLELVTHAENLRRSNSISTQHANATACPLGHPYDEANTYRNPRNGDRQCRECRRRHDRNRQPRKAN